MSKRITLISWVLLLALPAAWTWGLIRTERGNSPVKDDHWPAGAVEVANVKSRIGWWEGPPFGGGMWQFLYRGDARAFQEALDLFARVRAPELRLVVHEGPHENTLLRDEKHPDAHVDWAFTIWNPNSWNHLYNNPRTTFTSEEPEGGFRKSVDRPRIDVYVAAADGKGIDWKAVKVPAGVTMTDERTTSAGYPADAGSVIRGDVYDVQTSKPIGGANVLVAKFSGKVWEKVSAAAADADGHFEIKTVPTGWFRVSVSAEGYVSRVLGHAEIGPNTLKQYVAQLAPPASVTGTISDTHGKALGGVTVRADDVIGEDGRGYVLPEDVQTTADASGRFELKGLPAGYLQLHASDKSHQMLDALKQYEAPAADVQVRMTATGMVKGKVLRRNGKPAADADVSIEPEGDPIGKWGGSTKVKPDGSFVFENVPPGNYTASASPGMARLGKDPAAKKIEVKEGETVEVELRKQ